MRREDFFLEPNCVFLNHGSFGLLPKVVFEEQMNWIRKMETQSTHFFVRELPSLYLQSMETLGQFLNCSPLNLQFVSNTTTGVNIIAQNIDWKEGDEVILLNCEYQPLISMWKHYSKTKGVQIKTLRLNFPLKSNEEIVDLFDAAITARTKMIYVSHIVSAFGCILPVKELTQLGRMKSILVAIDGAHAPGQIPLDLTDLDPDFYVGNLHKWVNTPKTAGFIYIHPSYMERILPNVLSYGLDALYPGMNRMQSIFFWQGTRDCTALLCLPKALEYLNSISIETYQNHGRSIAEYGMEEALKLSGLDPIYDPQSNFYAMMSACPLPPLKIDVPTIRRCLWEEKSVEVLVDDQTDLIVLRVSGNLYNTKDDIDRMIEALRWYL